MIQRKPIAERILETLITLHNRDSGNSLEGSDETQNKAFSAPLEEPILTLLAERGYIIFGGPTGDTPFLNNSGKAHYASLISQIQQDIVR